MCGIYGLWSSRRRFPATALGASLAHRGPDDEGCWSAEVGPGTLHLGHRRLAIRDLSPQGHQPIVAPDERFVLTYNGEIYNDLALRAELEARGVRFTSTCDTEVLLHGFAAWGIGVLERLRGMFAFAIWDRDEERLVLARDATGIKPLYVWPLASDEMAFASEVQTFARLPDAPFEIDLESIDEILGPGFVWSGDRTSIRGVRSVPAGCWLEVREGRIGEPVRWWTPPTPTAVVGPGETVLGPQETVLGPQETVLGPQETVLGPQETVLGPDETLLDREADRLHGLLDRVVAEHLRSDVPVGLLLSGGLDSSVLAALAARHAPVPLRTVTMGFEPYDRDEREHARAVVDHLVAGGHAIEHHEVVVRPEDAASTLVEHGHRLDDFFGDSGTIPAFAAFAHCRALGLKVVLVGEGADEVFGGYPVFRRLVEAADGRAPEAWIRHLAYRGYTRRRYGRDRRSFARLWRRLLEQAGGDWFHAVRLFECQVQLPSSLNRKVDRASMASSVEARVPYQDRRVLDFAFGLPRELFLDLDTPARQGGKRLLRHMARRHDLVPEPILERPKMGTPVPWDWLRDGSAFAESARQILLAPDGWARRLGLEQAVQDLFAGSARPLVHRLERHTNRGWLAMQLLMLEAWSSSKIFDGE